MEEWRSLEELGLSNYSISSWGRVRNDKFRRDVAQSLTQAGHVKVSLNNDAGQRQTVSVTRLVAEHFLPGKTFICNTPIHLDGNKEHTFVENLAWRPLWFAVKYHKQFQDDRNWIDVPIVDINSGEEFPDAHTAVVKYGLLKMDIIHSITNEVFVYPTAQEFRHVY